MPQSIPEPSPQTRARSAGFFWLLTILTSMCAFLIAGKFVAVNDPATTAANMVAHESAFRLAGTTNLIATICYLAVTLLIYELLRPVNKSIALFGVLVSLIGCVVGGAGCLLFLLPIGLLHEAQSTGAVALLALTEPVNNIGFVFFGLHVLSIGYLIRKSSFLPSFLGVLLTITGLCYLTSSFFGFLALPFANRLMPIVAAFGLIGEDTLTFWLLIAGVNTRRWQEQASVAAECGSCTLPLGNVTG